jgi:hypothetical protein
MNEITRRIQESPLYQGVDEQIAYTLTTTPWGSSPSSVSVVIKNAAGTDVSATCLSGSASVNGNIITTPVVKSLTADAQYRLEIKFTCSGNIFEVWADIYGQA